MNRQKSRNFKLLYNEALEEILSSKENFHKFLNYWSNIYKYNFHQAVLLYGQNKEATMLADYVTWQKVNRQVKRGSKAIYILEENDTVRALFDIKDTIGKTIPYNFRLDENIKNDFTDYINKKLQLSNKTLEEIAFLQIKSVLKGYDKNLIYIATDVVMNRLNLKGFNIDKLDIEAFSKEPLKNGQIVHTAVKNVIKAFDTELKLFKVELEAKKEAAQPKQLELEEITGKISKETEKELNSNGDKIHKELSAGRNRDTGAGVGVRETEADRSRYREIRTNVARLHEGELSGRASENDVGGRSDENSISSERRSISDEREADGAEEAARTSRTDGLPEQASENKNDRTGSRKTSDRGDSLEAEDIRVGFYPKQRFKDNVAAIKTLKQLEEENRLPTNIERNILNKYVGWGGLAESFDENKKDWSNEYNELKGLLTEEEYISARGSVTDSFYTGKRIINAMYKALQDIGFDGGEILEPSMGIGNFFNVMPKEIYNNSNLTGIEVDSLSARIAKKLYDTANIDISGFETTNYKNKFDLAIGNIPFGNFQIADEELKGLLVHDYFFEKALEEVKPGGIIAFITFKGTMDKKDNSVRQYIADRADLLRAVRLPNTTFKGIADTDVVTDILFLQKKEKIIKSNAGWINTQAVNKDGLRINSYFAHNPAKILGEMVLKMGKFGQTTDCIAPKDYDLYGNLEKALKGISLVRSLPERTIDLEKTENIGFGENEEYFKYFIKDNKVFYKELNKIIQVKLSKEDTELMKELDSFRKEIRNVIDSQLNGCTDEELKKLQEELNKKYDSIVKKENSITFSSRIKTLFRDDDDYFLICSVEKVTDADKKEVIKENIFTERTIRKLEVKPPENALESMIQSLNIKGKLDFEYMSKIYLKSKEEIIKELELRKEIYKNPENNSYELKSEYLSGNVRRKLEIAVKYSENNPEFLKNVEALKKVIPKDLNEKEIAVKLGNTWLEPKDIEKFMYEKFQTPERLWKDKKLISINYNQITGEWNIYNKKIHESSMANSTYGTTRQSAYELLEQTLNLKLVTIYDVVKEDGKERRVANLKETTIAREKQRKLQGEFKEWIWKEPQRKAYYLEKYNRLYNCDVLREYDGSSLVFPQMSSLIELKPHQKNAVARMLYSGKNTLLAHEVGAGKTFEMITAAMEKKRLGLINKSLITVPNHLVEQTTAEFLKLYPAAKILAVTKEDFAAENRKRFINKIAMTNYDAIIIAHSQFSKIPISLERREEYIECEIEELSTIINNSNKITPTIKQLETYKKKLKAKLDNLYKNKDKDNVLTFEQLGVDQIIVDEAHMFKSLPTFSKMQNVSGIQNSPSRRAEDMYLKTKYISEINPNGVIFATGTPVANTMTEIFIMQKYLQENLLREKGLIHFDSWAANFGEIVSSLELKPEGSGFSYKNRFAKFVNLPELMTMFKEVADIQTAEMLNLPRPKANFINIATKPSEFTKCCMKHFAQRAEKIRKGMVLPKIDNMLKITNEARMLGTDPRIIEPLAENLPNSKVNTCIEQIYKEYINSDDIKGTQIVFLDVSTPTGKKEFCLYDYIKDTLIKKGIPENEICYIHDANTDKQKEALFADLRNGKKRIILGSTSKMGTGTNIQNKLVALHHLDCPWRPADVQQREGRILRQGNQNKEVNIYKYVTQDTFDAYNWQLIEKKQTFISQIMSNRSLVERECADIDETTLSYAEIKALTLGDPRIREQIELDNEINRLKLLKQGYINSLKYFEKVIEENPKSIEEAEKDISLIKKDIENRNSFKEEFKMKVGDITFTKRAEAGENLVSAIEKAKFFEKIKIADYKNFEISIKKGILSNFEIYLKGNKEYSLDVDGLNPLGTIMKIEHAINNNLEKNLENKLQRVDNLKNDLITAQEAIKKPFEQEKELKEKLERQCKIREELELDKVESVIAEENLEATLSNDIEVEIE